jgi:hypothetical protein
VAVPPGALQLAPRYSHTAAEHDGTSSLGDVKSSLGDTKSLLGDAKSSLGDTKSLLGDTKSSLGDTKSLLGDVQAAEGWTLVTGKKGAGASGSKSVSATGVVARSIAKNKALGLRAAGVVKNKAQVRLCWPHREKLVEWQWRAVSAGAKRGE